MIRLKEEREAKSITQQALAKVSGIPQQTISAIESGERRNPGIGTMIALACALGCNVMDLWVPDKKSDDVDGFQEVSGDE